MSELPSGWVTAPIGDLCTLKNGRAFKPSDWSATGVPIVRIQNLNNPAAPHNYYHGSVDERHRLRGGELLFAWSGTPGTSFGAHIWRGGEAVLNQHIFRVDFDGDALDKRFFRFAINARLDDLIGVAHGGVGLRHVTKGVFERTPILLPPRAEQTRIADQLDTLLARIRACQHRLDAIPALLKRFRQAVMGAATSGELIGKAPAAVPVAPLRTLLAEPLRNGKSARDGEGLPVLRLTALRHCHIELGETKTGDWSSVPDVRRFLIEDGDYLVSRGNGSKALVGRGGLVVGCTREIAFPDTMIRIRPDKSRLLPDFLKHVWETARVRAQIEEAAKTTAGIWKVSQPDLEAVALPLPSIEDQAEIVHRIDALLSIASRLEARHAAAAARCARLIPLALAKAFRGDLVEQHPQDEPATELLARLAESRDAQPRPARGRKRGAGTQPSTSQPNDVPDWLALPDGAWACPPDPEGLRASVLLTAVLRAWGGREAPQSQARLAYLLCEQPRLLSAVLPQALAQQWQRLVGDEARPVSAEVSVLQPAVNIAWRRAVIGMRARGDLLDLGAGADATWALGAGADAIETKGWPQGRAGFVVGYLRAHGSESVLPTLEPAQREFVDARAA